MKIENDSLKQELELLKKEDTIKRLKDSINNFTKKDVKPKREKTTYSNYLISKSQAGDIKIDMPIESLSKYFKNDQIVKSSRTAEGMEYDVYEIYNKKKSGILMVVEPDCERECNVNRIYLKSSKYKTKEGIGVGNKFYELNIKYNPEAIIGTETGNIVYYTKEYGYGLGFVFSGKSLHAFPDKSFKEFEIPEDRGIIEIYIY